MSAIEVQNHLNDLLIERALASVEGLDGHAAYMADLEHEIVVTRIAYVAAAVTDIAMLRAELFGPQLG